MEKQLYKIWLVLAGAVCLLTGCQEDYFVNGGLESSQLGVSTYDFVASRPKEFDTLLWTIDRSGLKEVINQSNSTFFMPQDAAFKTFLENRFRGEDDVPTSLDNLPEAVADTLGILLRKYIVNQSVKWNDIPVKGGLELTNIENEPVRALFRESFRGGVEGFGPKTLEYSMKGKFDFDGQIIEINRSAAVSSSNLESTNGMIHVLSPLFHELGFGFKTL